MQYAAASLALALASSLRKSGVLIPGVADFPKVRYACSNGSIPLCDHLEIETLAAAAVTLNFLFRKTFSPYVDFSLLYIFSSSSSCKEQFFFRNDTGQKLLSRKKIIVFLLVNFLEQN